jgi:exosortase
MQKFKQLLRSMLTGANLGIVLKVFFILLVIIVLYFQDFLSIFNSSIHDESSFHILALPFLLFYLIYRKRKVVKATLSLSESNIVPQRHLKTIIGVLFCASAEIIYWMASSTFTPIEFHIFTLPIWVAGLVLIMFNLQTLKQLAFPILFLLLLIPPPVKILYGVGSVLSVFSIQVSSSLVNLLGVSSTITNQYGNPIVMLTRSNGTSINFMVDNACSGVFSLIGFLIFAIFIAYITRAKIYAKATIFMMGIPLILLLNTLRLSVIFAIAYYWGDQLALQVFHLLGATVLMFIGTLILLVVTEKIFNRSRVGASTKNSNLRFQISSYVEKFDLKKQPISRADCVKILAIILVIITLLSIQVPIFALTEGPAELMIETPSGRRYDSQILPNIQNYNLSYIYRDIAYEDAQGVDAALVFAYSSNETTRPNVWVAIQIASSQSLEHSWDYCLSESPLNFGYASTIHQLDSRDIQISENPPIILRYFGFQYLNSNQTQVVLYWYQTSVFQVDNSAQSKSVMISLITYPSHANDVIKYEEMLYPFAIAINNYWQPIQRWTPVAIALSENGVLILGSIIISLAFVLFYYALLTWRQRASNLKLYNKLSEQDKSLVQAIIMAQKNGKSTAEEILSCFESINATTVSNDYLVRWLEQAVNSGLVSKRIENVNDQPVFMWRSQVLVKNSFLNYFIKT